MTGYTHRHWRIEATGIRDALDQLLVPALEHMRAGLVAVQAGREQRAKAGEFIKLVGELADEGTRILGDHDARLRRVSEAQAAAGGVTEVAGRKRYHQR
jgi:hypothetical protein